MKNTQHKRYIAEKMLICTLFLISHISGFSQSHEPILTSDIKDTTTQQEDIMINNEDDIIKLLNFSTREINDYPKIIGKTILINPKSNNGRYYNVLTKPDTIWLKRKTRKPKTSDYKIVEYYKHKNKKDTIYVQGYGVHIASYDHTPSEEIHNKQFFVNDIIFAEKLISVILTSVSTGDSLVLNTTLNSYDENRVNLNQITVVEEIQQVKDFFIGRKYYDKKDDQIYTVNKVEVAALRYKSDITLSLSSEKQSTPSLDVSFDKLLTDFRNEQQQLSYENWILAEEQKELERKQNAGSYQATLIKVEKPANSQIKYGKTSTVTEKELLKYKYEDNIINILWFVSNDNFNFVLKNKSPYSLKIIWDDAVYIDEGGSTDKVFHIGTKYTERNNSQPPSVVLKDATLTDLLAPVSKVYYSDGWGQNNLFPSHKSDNIENKTVRVSLPIQIQGTTNEYVFTFKISWRYAYPELQATH